MALTWPDKKVALDIVDDPAGERFSGDEREWEVVRVTCAELENYATFRQVMNRVAQLLGQQAPTDPDWQDRNRALHRTLMAAHA